ncbi:MAG: hypothetical protein QM692_16060 [Thermomicrobiales bacterium]
MSSTTVATKPIVHTGLRIDIDGDAYEVTWDQTDEDGGLSAWQYAVDGYVETIELPTLGMTLVVNDRENSADEWAERLNPYATRLRLQEIGRHGHPIADAVAGPVLVVSNRVTRHGDAIGLTGRQVAGLRRMIAVEQKRQRS